MKEPGIAQHSGRRLQRPHRPVLRSSRPEGRRLGAPCSVSELNRPTPWAWLNRLITFSPKISRRRPPRAATYCTLRSVCDSTGVRPSLPRPAYMTGAMPGLSTVQRLTGSPLATDWKRPMLTPNGAV